MTKKINGYEVHCKNNDFIIKAGNYDNFGFIENGRVFSDNKIGLHDNKVKDFIIKHCK